MLLLKEMFLLKNMLLLVLNLAIFSVCLRGVFHIILDTFLKLKNIVMLKLVCILLI